jgi:uncharacterized protein (UPF0276 family)
MRRFFWIRLILFLWQSRWGFALIGLWFALGTVAFHFLRLLLDLHNVLANGLNHGYDPLESVRQIPPERIAAIHIAGGKFISAPDGTQRLLDDHFHDVPDPVFDLLEETAARAPGALTVILERDGEYPSMDSLLAQIAQARRALAKGRQRRMQPVEAVA